VDIVYICRFGDNEELRYSIRSLVNVPHDEIWVVGGRPGWYNGKYIGVRPMADKYAHARENLKNIVLDKRISENFILMNDDFFIIEPVDCVEYFHNGSIEQKIKTYKQAFGVNSYVEVLENSLKTLNDLNTKTRLDYALHVPMVMSKTKLKVILKHPGSVRINYGNIYEVGGSQMEDVKVHLQSAGGPRQYDYMRPRSPYLSTNDQTFKSVKDNLLHKLFPNRSDREYR